MNALAILWAATCIAFCAASHAVSAQALVVRADAAPTWGTSVRLVSSATIGVLDGSPEYAFGSVDYLVGERNGGFFVYDANYVQIRHYDAAGKFVANIGRVGSGPGEYRRLLGMALVGDSLLVVWDPDASRVTSYGADGKVRRSFTTLLGGAVYGPDVFAVDYLGIISIQSPRMGPNGKPQYVRFHSDGRVLDTLRSSVQARVGPVGFVLLTADGDRPSFDDDQIVKPALRDVFTDRDGRVWLSVYTVAEKRLIPPRPKGDPRPLITWRERSTYDVFAIAGSYLGRVVLPLNHQLLDVSGDRLWAL